MNTARKMDGATVIFLNSTAYDSAFSHLFVLRE